MNPERPYVLVTVGTDHHPFDRLLRWVDRWAVSERGRGVRWLIQSGTARPPRRADWSPFLNHQDLMTALQAASVVVAHAGPGTVMSCRSAGLLPIVVPRRRAFREAVDDHQVGFAARMATRGQVVVAWSAEHLASLLDRAVGDPTAFRAPPEEEERIQGVVDRFGRLVDGLLEASTPPPAHPTSGRWTDG
jgi:UDP-N-acetylglucosamine transferase subunit ALG13